MIFTGTPLVWHVGELPDSDTAVIVITEDKEVGEGFHDGEEWRWASGACVSRLVVCWAHHPEPVEVMALIRDGREVPGHG